MYIGSFQKSMQLMETFRKSMVCLWFVYISAPYIPEGVRGASLTGLPLGARMASGKISPLPPPPSQIQHRALWMGTQIRKAPSTAKSPDNLTLLLKAQGSETLSCKMLSLKFQNRSKRLEMDSNCNFGARIFIWVRESDRLMSENWRFRAVPTIIWWWVVL